MYALKPPAPTPTPERPRRPKRRVKQVKRQKASYEAIAYEAAAKLSVNALLSVAAIGALMHLLPYRGAQETKIHELDAAVQSTSERLGREQEKFSYYFDSYQMRETMQELTDRIDPNRRRVVWKTPAPPTPPKAAPATVPAN